jgi:Fe-S-cluster-containing hydrogenase component 2
MVRSSTKHNQSSQSSADLDKLKISERQKKTSIKGTVTEYEAIAKLTRQGYYVAKSCDPACPFDIVIVDKKGKIQLLDIKTNTYRKYKKGKSLKNKPKKSCLIYRCPTKEQKKLGIKLMMVDYD